MKARTSKPRAPKPTKKRKVKPPRPRTWGPVAFPVFLRREGMHLISKLNKEEFRFARARRVTREKDEIALALGPCPLTVPWPVDVIITRISPGHLDTDNLASACKSVRDLVAWWLGLDDGRGERDGRVTWHTEQRKAGKGAYHVEISIVAKGLTLAAELDALVTKAREDAAVRGVF